MDDQCQGRLEDSSPNQKVLHKESCGERAQELGCWASNQKADSTWSDCHCLKGHYLTEGAHTPKGHSCPGDLGLEAKDVSISDLHGEEGLKPSGSGLAWVPIHPHSVLAQASMKENLVAAPQGFPEMSLPRPHPVPIPSLPKSIRPVPSLTLWVTISIVEQSDSSSPCSRSPDPATPAPSWRRSRDRQEDPLNKENVLVSLG